MRQFSSGSRFLSPAWLRSCFYFIYISNFFRYLQRKQRRQVQLNKQVHTPFIRIWNFKGYQPNVVHDIILLCFCFSLFCFVSFMNCRLCLRTLNIPIKNPYRAVKQFHLFLTIHFSNCVYIWFLVGDKLSANHLFIHVHVRFFVCNCVFFQDCCDIGMYSAAYALNI